jgi:hypothetical protein
MILKRIIAISAIFLSPFLAYAVTVSEDVTLVLPSDSSEYTLTAAQNTFDTLTINNASFDFVLSGGQEILIKSSDKKNFTSTRAGSFECQTSQSVLSVSKPEGESAETVTVTPSGNCATSSGGGGGTNPSLGQYTGGGGGPAYQPLPLPFPASASTAPTASSIQQQILAIQAKIAGLQGAQAPVGTPPAYGVFARVMDPGDKDDEVRRLQGLLKTDSEVYPEGLVTGYYGTLTRNAVRRFQLKYGVIPNENALGNGRVGPKTMAKLNEIFGGMAAPTPAPASVVPQPISAPAPQASVFQVQAIRDQIKAIQAKLIQEQIKLIQEKINALK